MATKKKAAKAATKNDSKPATGRNKKPTSQGWERGKSVTIKKPD